jgi:hypothetical protein
MAKSKQPTRSVLEIMERLCKREDCSLNNTQKKLIADVYAAEPTVDSRGDTTVFVVKKLPASLNVRDTQHWYVKHQSQEVWDGIAYLARHRSPPFRLEYPLLLEYTSYRVALLDADNNAASIKQFIDGLVHAGILKNDSTDYIRYYVSFQEKVQHRTEQCAVMKFTSIPDDCTCRVVIGERGTR